MDSDAILKRVVDTFNVGLLHDLPNLTDRIDPNSQHFPAAIELCIRNGDDTAFARLLDCIPNLRVKRSKAPQALTSNDNRHLIVRIFDFLREQSYLMMTLVVIIFILSQSLQTRLVSTVFRMTGIHVTNHEVWLLIATYFMHPISLSIIPRIWNVIRKGVSKEVVFDVFDGVLVFLFLGVAVNLVPQSTWFGRVLYEGLHSSTAIWGMSVRLRLLHFMPNWRQMYFKTLLGADHVLAWAPERKVTVADTDYGAVIVPQLLKSQCNELVLMRLFLERASFDDISEEEGIAMTIFAWSAEKGSLPLLQALRRKGITFDAGATASTDSIPTSLYWAATNGHATVVAFLLTVGTKVTAALDRALLAAVKGAGSGSYDRSIDTYAECVNILLSAGASPDVIDSNGRSVLSWSSSHRLQVIHHALLQAEADANVADDELRLPLHHAAKLGRSDGIVAALLARTQSPNSHDKDGTSALTWALWSADCPTTIKLLVDVAIDINQGGGVYGTPLGAASRYCSGEVVKLLLEKGADPNSQGNSSFSCLEFLLARPFNTIVLEDDLYCLELLLKHGANPNAITENGEHALHKAARTCRLVRVFELLLDHGANINATCKVKEWNGLFETTPLGITCHMGVGEKAPLFLLGRGASPNCYTPSGQTALQEASGILGSSTVARELIKRGADIEARSFKYTQTPLHAAATGARSDMVRLLLESGVDVNAKNFKMDTPLHETCWRALDGERALGDTPNHFELRRSDYTKQKEMDLIDTIATLLAFGRADPLARDIEGATPLHHGVKARNPLTVATIDRFSAIDVISAKDFQGRLPLHYAAEIGFTDVLLLLAGVSGQRAYSAQLQQSLVNAVDMLGNLPLHYAAKNGHEDFIMRLVETSNNSNNFSLKNGDGHTAVDLARKGNHVYCVKLLEDLATKIPYKSSQ